MNFLRAVFASALCCCCCLAAANDGKMLVSDYTGSIDKTDMKALSDRVYFINLNDVAMRWIINFDLSWVENKAEYMAAEGLPSDAIVFLVGLKDGRMQILFGDAFNSARRRHVIPWVEKIISEQFLPVVREGNAAKAVSDSITAFEGSAHGIKNNYDNLTWLLACGVLAVGAFLLWEHRERRKVNIYLAGLMVTALIGMGAYAVVKFLTFSAQREVKITWTPASTAIAEPEPAPVPAAANTVR